MTIYVNGNAIGASTVASDSTVSTDGITRLPDGTYTFTADQTLANPAIGVNDWRGSIALVSGGSDGIQVTIHAAPQFTSTPASNHASVGQTYRYLLSGSAPSGDTVTFALISPLAGMKIENNEFIWTPQPGQAGQKTVAIGAYDAAGSAASQTFAIYVADLVDRPTVVLPDGPGGNCVTVRRRSGQIQVFDETTHAILRSLPLASLQSLTILGASDTLNTLTVDFSFGGNFLILNGIAFQGGSGAATDTLIVRGTAGNDTFKVQAGRTNVNGLRMTCSGVEQLRLEGRAGNDRYLLPSSNVPVTIGDSAGIDEMSFLGATRGVTVNLSLQNGQPQQITPWHTTLSLLGTIEYLAGSNYADVLIGSAGANVIRGFGGADTIRGLGGNDVLIGGLGADKIYGGPGNDILIGGTTDYDQNPGALMALLNRGTVQAGRTAGMRGMTAGAVAALLRIGASVHNDGSRDVLYGGRDDWFLRSGGDSCVAK